MAKDKYFDDQVRTAGVDPFLLKLSAASLKAKGGESKCCSNFKLGYTNLVTFFKRAATLFVFHLLNIPVVIGGVIFAALMITNTALAPCWFVTYALGVFAFLVIGLVMLIRQKWLRYLGYLLLAALFVLSLMNAYTATIPSCAYSAACCGFILFWLCGYIVHGLVKKEIQLANFANSVVNSTSKAVTLDPEDCTSRFTFPDIADLKFFSPHITLTRRVWTLIFYYTVLKVVVGAMSAVVIVLAVIQPIVVLCTIGNDPFVGSWIVFQDHPTTYVGIVLLLWLAGAIGLSTVAKLSVKLTSTVCGEWKSDQKATMLQEDDVEAAVSSTPAQEPRHTSFTQM